MKTVFILLMAMGLSASHALADEVVGSGTAFVVNDEGWAVTNAHVVNECSRVATQSGGATSELKIDVGNDLAALKLAHPVQASLELRRAGARLGEDIAALGYPLGNILSSSVKVTTGNVNSLMGLGDDTRYLQISTPIQPGNSGGPVVDKHGSVIGVTTSTLKPEAGGDALPQNVNFALRASLVMSFLESRGVTFELSEDGKPELATADLAEKVQPAVVQLLCYGTIDQEAANRVAEPTSLPKPEPFSPSRPFSYLDDYDVVGFDYATLKNVSQGQCQRACNDDAQCQAITYNKKQRFCFLKRGAALLVKNSDAFASVADPLSSRVRVSSFVIGAGRDMAGGDYKRFRSDFVGCYLQCELETQCQAFSYVRAKKECWLKDVLGQVTRKAGVDTGMK